MNSFCKFITIYLGCAEVSEGVSDEDGVELSLDLVKQKLDAPIYRALQKGLLLLVVAPPLARLNESQITEQRHGALAGMDLTK